MGLREIKSQGWQRVELSTYNQYQNHIFTQAVMCISTPRMHSQRGHSKIILTSISQNVKSAEEFLKTKEIGTVEDGNKIPNLRFYHL